MIENKDVVGTQKSVDGIEFNKDTIYIRSNIRKEYDDSFKKEIWIYDEIQYTFNEYLEVLNTKVDKSNKAHDDLILDNAYRVALLELNAQGIAL